MGQRLDCRNCQKRKFGCHSTCQLYVVNRVINRYKQEKKVESYESCYNSVAIVRNNQKLRKQLNGFA